MGRRSIERTGGRTSARGAQLGPDASDGRQRSDREEPTMDFREAIAEGQAAITADASSPSRTSAMGSWLSRQQRSEAEVAVGAETMRPEAARKRGGFGLDARPVGAYVIERDKRAGSPRGRHPDRSASLRARWRGSSAIPLDVSRARGVSRVVWRETRSPCSSRRSLRLPRAGVRWRRRGGGECRQEPPLLPVRRACWSRGIEVLVGALHLARGVAAAAVIDRCARWQRCRPGAAGRTRRATSLTVSRAADPART
jgi:hypothetical protein